MKMHSVLAFVGLLCSGLPLTHARMYIDDGGIHNIDFTIPEELWVDRDREVMGTTVNVLDGGCIIGDLEGFGTSNLNIFGGCITDDLQANESTTLQIFAGAIGDTLYVGGGDGLSTATARMWGGSFHELRVFSGSVMTIFGSDFAVDGSPVDYGELPSLLGGRIDYEPNRRLTGMLSNGDVLDTPFLVGDTAFIVLAPNPVPTPGAFVLAAVGLLYSGRRLCCGKPT